MTLACRGSVTSLTPPRELVPAADYRLAALTDLEASDLADPSFLNALVAAAVAVLITDGGTVSQNLQIAK
jgi:hypothetical protein